MRSALEPLPRPIPTPAAVGLALLVLIGTAVAVARYLNSPELDPATPRAGIWAAPRTESLPVPNPANAGDPVGMSFEPAVDAPIGEAARHPVTDFGRPDAAAQPSAWKPPAVEGG